MKKTNINTSIDQAAQFIAEKAGRNLVDCAALLNGNMAVLNEAYRLAAKKLHPDAGGRHEEFILLQDAKHAIEAHHGRCEKTDDDAFPLEDPDFTEVELPKAFYDDCTCRIDELMALSGMNRRQVAEALGTSQMSVGRWLEGVKPRRAMIERIDGMIAEYAELARNSPDEFSGRVASTIAGW